MAKKQNGWQFTEYHIFVDDYTGTRIGLVIQREDKDGIRWGWSLFNTGHEDKNNHIDMAATIARGKNRMMSLGAVRRDLLKRARAAFKWDRAPSRLRLVHQVLEDMVAGIDSVEPTLQEESTYIKALKGKLPVDYVGKIKSHGN